MSCVPFHELSVCWPHPLPSSAVSPLAFPSKTGRCLLSFSLSNLLVALDYPIRAAERWYCISNADSTPAVAHKSSVVCSTSSLLAYPTWFQLLCDSPWASSAPTMPTLSPRTPALPILLTRPALLATPLGHLPHQPSPHPNTCCFLLESSSLHAWWACSSRASC